MQCAVVLLLCLCGAQARELTRDTNEDSAGDDGSDKPRLRGRDLITFTTSGSVEGQALWTSNSGVWQGVLQLVFPHGSTTVRCTGTVVFNGFDAQSPPRELLVVLTAPECLPTPRTTTTTWDGVSMTLGTSFKVFAGDSGATEVGYMESAQYVSQAAEGNRLAALRVRPNAFGSNIPFYPCASTDLGTLALGRALGYGPGVVTRTSANVVTPTGAGVLRSAPLYVSSIGAQLGQVGTCASRSSGGAFFFKTENYPTPPYNQINLQRLCPITGDLGAPFFTRDTTSSPWVLAGVFVSTDDIDCMGVTEKPNAEMEFTSITYRNGWVRTQTAVLQGAPVAPSPCPSFTPTPAPTPTPTPSVTSSPSPTVNYVAPSPSPPPPFFERQVNVIWVSILAGVVGLVVFSGFGYIAFKQAQIRSFHRQGLKYKKALALTPAKGQVVVQAPTEYEAQQKEIGERTREGEYLAYSRAPVSAEQLAATEAARTARKERRRSSIAMPEGGKLPGRESRVGGVSGASAPVGGGAPASTPGVEGGDGATGRRGSVGGSGGPQGKGRRRNSLAMARGVDRGYDTNPHLVPPVGGTGGRADVGGEGRTEGDLPGQTGGTEEDDG